MRAIISALLLSLIASPAAAQSAQSGTDHWYGEEYQQCDGSTVEMVECISGLGDDWDARLNEAYRTLLAADDGRSAALRDAQRRWIAYRDANCAWYADGEGSIARIEAATCLYVLTRDRALELEMTAEQR
jgi:uncharacterized protein YecT (DUF1311 family)